MINNKYPKIWLLTLFILLLAWPAISGEERTFDDVIAQNSEGSYVFLFAHRSAAYLDWSSPSTLARTTLNSLLTRKLEGRSTTIGHAQLAWHCRTSYGLVIDGATGQTGENSNQGLELLKQGWGLSILDMIYLDGSLETPEEVAQKIAIADHFGNFAWIGLQVPVENCLQLADFVRNYRNSGAAVNYGFPADPFKYEGAGCTSFASAAFQTLKLDLPIIKSWVRHLRLPLKYMGRLQQAFPGTRAIKLAQSEADVKKVPMFDFFLQNLQWASESEPYQDFYYYDPELFYESMVHIENRFRQGQGQRLRSAIRTKDYDPSQAHTKAISEEWIDWILKNGGQVRLDQIRSTTGLVVDLTKINPHSSQDVQNTSD